jgi:hypothetical protein
MFLLIERNDDAVLGTLVERRICELRTVLRRYPKGEHREALEREKAALERVLHRLHEAAYDVMC